jgi:hypothetical protein
MMYDISVWEGIRARVEREISGFDRTVKGEISRDRSLQEHYGIYPVPWQLGQVLWQRADAWIQRLYKECCNVYGKETSLEFDQAVWAYFIEPLIMREVQVNEQGYRASRLLELLLCAVGSLPENRRQLRVDQKSCCLQVRTRIYDAWYAKLNHVTSKVDEAATVMARFNAMEVRAARIAAGLPTEPLPSADTRNILPSTSPVPIAIQSPQTVPVSGCEQPASEHLATAPPPSKPVHGSSEIRPRSWDEIEVSFLSEHRVQIVDGAKTETLNYAEFGFEDGRSEKPNLAWETLRTLAEQEGVLKRPTKTGETWAHVEKRIQTIRKILCEYFRIPSDPIPFVERIGYKANFKIRCRQSYRS